MHCSSEQLACRNITVEVLWMGETDRHDAVGWMMMSMSHSPDRHKLHFSVLGIVTLSEPAFHPPPLKPAPPKESLGHSPQPSISVYKLDSIAPSVPYLFILLFLGLLPIFPLSSRVFFACSSLARLSLCHSYHLLTRFSLFFLCLLPLSLTRHVPSQSSKVPSIRCLANCQGESQGESPGKSQGGYQERRQTKGSYLQQGRHRHHERRGSHQRRPEVLPSPDATT